MTFTQFLAFTRSPNKSVFRDANRLGSSQKFWRLVYIEKIGRERKVLSIMASTDANREQTNFFGFNQKTTMLRKGTYFTSFNLILEKQVDFK